MNDKKATWEAQSRQWDRQVDDPQNKYTRMSDLVAKLLQRHLKTGRVLDVGCGPGALCLKLADSGFDVYGTDLADAMIKASIGRLGTRFPDAANRFRVCRDGVLPFQNNLFDVITAIHLFPYIERQTPFIRHLASLLRSDGIIIASGTNRHSLWVLHEMVDLAFRVPPHLRTIRSLWRTGYHSGGHVNYHQAEQAYCARDFDALFSREGFDVVDCMDYFHIAWLDRSPLERSGFGRRMARRLAWQHVGVYRSTSGRTTPVVGPEGVRGR